VPGNCVTASFVWPKQIIMLQHTDGSFAPDIGRGGELCRFPQADIAGIHFGGRGCATSGHSADFSITDLIAAPISERRVRADTRLSGPGSDAISCRSATSLPSGHFVTYVSVRKRLFIQEALAQIS
ncbi:hypothetical protein, partial [Mesorhizobium sp.]|uniref:hypothetical protein n=1 Tax=Mesorhizobium sp. TaxID=1871066 RepID=UPI002580F30E